MSRKLKSEPRIRVLARDLGLPMSADPAGAIQAYCRQRLLDLARKTSCQTPSELLAVAQDHLGTYVREVRTHDELVSLRHEYTSRRELRFAQLADDLRPGVFAITFKLLSPKKGERPYVSVIDCRGEKAPRAYFSKWHELAHLLTLTSQTRLTFCRTHGDESDDPEERLMESIAGDGAFLPELIVPHIQEPISFDAIYRLRQALCPEASDQASLIGFVRAWPTPCMFVRAEMGLRRDQQRSLAQGRLEFHDPPVRVLRAIDVTVNDAAQRTGLVIPRNMRVPEDSVIKRAFLEGRAHVEADEDLSSWTTSKGERLPARAMHVVATNMKDHIRALVTPKAP